MGKNRFRRPLIRLVTSIGVAAFITLIGRWHKIDRAFVTPAFYIALITSIFIAYILLTYLHYSNKRLNRKFPYPETAKKRIPRQIIYGIIIPIIFELAMIKLYYIAIDRSMLKSQFLTVDFPIVVFCLIIINRLYLRDAKLHSSNTSKNKRSVEPFNIDYDGTHLTLNPITDIVYFYKDKKLTRVYTISGQEYASKAKIEYVAEKYEAAYFCQINPSAVVNLRMVQGYFGGATRDTWKPVFSLEHDTITKNADPKLLRITKRNFEKFKNNLEALQAEGSSL